MRRTWIARCRMPALAGLMLLASGCAERPVAIAPETAVPCRALVIVRPSAAEIDAMRDDTAINLDSNNAAIARGCGRRY